MADSEVLFARLPGELVEWVRQLARESGLSMSAVTRALLEDAHARGVKPQVTVR
jgi:hypothetical protein